MKLTQKHFEQFVKRCWYWIDRLQANHITWYFEKKPNDNASYAEYEYSRGAGGCVVTFTCSQEDFSYNETVDSFLNEVAFHEIAEVVLFGKMRDMLMEAGMVGKLNEITHESLHRAANLLGVAHGSKREKT